MADADTSPVPAFSVPAFTRSPAAAVHGRDVAAILMMLLDEEDAAAILRQLDPVTVRDLGAAMLGIAQADEGAIQTALGRFVEASRGVTDLAAKAEPRVRSVMSAALGAVRADKILASIAPRSSAVALDTLRWMEPSAIAELLAEEHPQVGAIIVAVLTPEAAAAALEQLDEARQTDLIWRAARLESVSAEAVAELQAVLAHAADRPRRKLGMRLGGKNDVARIFNTMKRPVGERMLRTLKKRDKLLGQAIEDEMFVFEDLDKLDDRSLGTVMQAIDAPTLALALRGAASPLLDRLLGTISARAAETIRDEMTERGPARRGDVEEAQKAAVAIARQLAASGEIMLAQGDEDYV